MPKSLRKCLSLLIGLQNKNQRRRSYRLPLGISTGRIKSNRCKRAMSHNHSQSLQRLQKKQKTFQRKTWS